MTWHGRRACAFMAVPAALFVVTSALNAQDGFDLPAAAHHKGDRNAKVVIVEFADFGCSSCAVFARATMPAVQRDWIATGRARVQLIPFDLLRTGRLAARAAECAAEQDAFWPMHDVLYQRQKDWLGRGGQREKFVAWARELGLDGKRFDACWDKDPSKELIDRNTKLARALGVRGTPTFLVNGKVIVGALIYEEFAALLEAAERGGRTSSPIGGMP